MNTTMNNHQECDGKPETEYTHQPVLYREVVAAFDFCRNRPAVIIDGTAGAGGHSALLLEANHQLRLIAIDRDSAALERAGRRLAFAGERVTLKKGCFSEIGEIAAECGVNEVDGILLDIGVSSPQIDDPRRGFSWRFDGPLDMRMDRSSELTGSRVLNKYSVEALTEIFRNYGELKNPARFARMIAEAREVKPFATTGDFADFCEQTLGKSRKGAPPVPTLPFQALRIAVNDELGELEHTLPVALKLLERAGHLAVISFHSLEDRIVKNAFKLAAASCICPPGLPVCCCGKKSEIKILTHKPIEAGKDEISANRRSACAKLRIAEKL